MRVCRSWPREYIAGMSTADVIDHLKKLPVREQAEVFRFLAEQLRASLPTQYAADKDFEVAMEKVLRENAGLMRRLAQ